MVDISREDELRRYLKECGILTDLNDGRIHYFGGGVSGVTAMAKLSDGRELIIKQACAKLNVEANWECDPKRIRIEHEALTVYRNIVPDCVPTPISFDDSNYVMIREAVPESWRMWKTDLLEGKLDYVVAEKAAAALAKVHNETAGCAAVEEQFGDRKIFYDLRVEPYVEYVSNRYPEIREKGMKLAHKLMSEQIALIHGDYSPKNILVHDDQICILDMEVATYGHPCFDLAFFTNHFLLKAVYRKQLADEYLKMLKCILDTYFKQQNYLDSSVLERDTVQTLAFLFLARVDGKSPVEYLKEKTDQEIVRMAALKMIRNDVRSYDQVIAILKEFIAEGEGNL